MSNVGVGTKRERIAMGLAVGRYGIIVKGGGSKSYYPELLSRCIADKFGKKKIRHYKGKRFETLIYPKIDFIAVPVAPARGELPRPVAVIVTDGRQYSRKYLKKLLVYMQGLVDGCDVKIYAFKKPKKSGLQYEIELFE